MKVISSSAYRFIRAALSCALPHPSTLRSYSEPHDIKAGIDVRHLETIGDFSENLPEKDRQCIIICDQGYGDEKLEYVNGQVLGIAENQTEIVAAKNILIFIVQAVFGKFRMVVFFYFVKNLDGSHLSKVLKQMLVAIEKCTKLRIVAWGSDHGPENKGCRSKLVFDEKTLPWSFPHPSNPNEAVLVILDASHLIKRIWAALIGKLRKLEVGKSKLTHFPGSMIC